MTARECERSDVLIRGLSNKPLWIGGTDRFAIGADRRSCLGDTIARDTDDANALFCRMFVRAEIRRRNPQWRMRRLDRSRQHMACRQIEALSLVAGEMFVLEHLHHGFERFAREREALFLRHAESLGHVRR